MTEEEARALLGLPVDVGGVRLGTVAAVWLDLARAAVGVEVGGRWNNGDTRFVPLPALSIGEGVLRASPFAVLTRGEATFYEVNGAERVALESSPDRFRPRPIRVERR